MNRTLLHLWFAEPFQNWGFAPPKQKDTHKSQPGIHAKREDTHILRLTSKLVDLRTGYVYRHPATPKACRTEFKSKAYTSKEKRQESTRGCGRVFAYGEDIHTLCLSSELADLRVGYVNRIPCASHGGRSTQSATYATKTKGHSQESTGYSRKA